MVGVEGFRKFQGHLKWARVRKDGLFPVRPYPSFRPGATVVTSERRNTSSRTSPPCFWRWAVAPGRVSNLSTLWSFTTAYRRITQRGSSASSDMAFSLYPGLVKVERGTSLIRLRRQNVPFLQEWSISKWSFQAGRIGVPINEAGTWKRGGSGIWRGQNNLGHLAAGTTPLLCRPQKSPLLLGAGTVLRGITLPAPCLSSSWCCAFLPLRWN